MKLLTRSCTLRGPSRADAPALAKHADNRNIWLTVRDIFPHPYTLKDAEKYIAAIADQEPRTSFLIDVDGEACGAIALRIGHDVERISAEIGYWLGESYWGRGIVTDAARAITEYGLTTLGLSRIFAFTMSENIASVRVLEKAGYSREALMRKAQIKNGKIHDSLLYARVAPD